MLAPWFWVLTSFSFTFLHTVSRTSLNGPIALPTYPTQLIHHLCFQWLGLLYQQHPLGLWFHHNRACVETVYTSGRVWVVCWWGGGWLTGQDELGNLSWFSSAVEHRNAPGCMVCFAGSIAAVKLKALVSAFALHSWEVRCWKVACVIISISSSRCWFGAGSPQTWHCLCAPAVLQVMDVLPPVCPFLIIVGLWWGTFFWQVGRALLLTGPSYRVAYLCLYAIRLS